MPKITKHAIAIVARVKTLVDLSFVVILGHPFFWTEVTQFIGQMLQGRDRTAAEL
jgi:hypothetical protein